MTIQRVGKFRLSCAILKFAVL